MRPLPMIGFIIYLLLPNSSHAQNDVPDSQDHPLISRYPGTYIVYYEQQNFDEYQLALGGLERNPDRTARDSYIVEKTKMVSGKVTRIQYQFDGPVSALEVYRNYQQALENAGFETLLDSHGESPLAAGGTSWTLRAYSNLPTQFKNALARSRDRSKRYYLVAKLAQPTGEIYVSVLSNQSEDDELRVQVDVIEVKPMEGGLVKVDAAYMAQELDRTGHIAIYDLHFDFDSATLKPESTPTLAEIAKLMNNDPKLNLFVVGHTDLVGDLKYNMQLSKERAHAVVLALIRDHGIAAERLGAHGVGPLVPVSSNRDDAGRAKNRRVELVAR